MLRGNRKHGPQQGEWNTDIVRVEGAVRSVRRKRKKTLVRKKLARVMATERALRSPKGQGQDGAG